MGVTRSFFFLRRLGKLDFTAGHFLPCDIIICDHLPTFFPLAVEIRYAIAFAPSMKQCQKDIFLHQPFGWGQM